MDTRQMEYIIQISEERSITKAAEKLFITQSALNQQLQKLEKELGLPLFVRTRSDWHLTPAGEIYVNTARQILNLKKDAYSQIQDLKESGNRRISLGLIPERGVNMFTAIYPEFHRKFPDIRIEPVECNVRTCRISSHAMSWILVLSHWWNPRRTTTPIFPWQRKKFFLLFPPPIRWPVWEVYRLRMRPRSVCPVFWRIRLS